MNARLPASAVGKGGVVAPGAVAFSKMLYTPPVAVVPAVSRSGLPSPLVAGHQRTPGSC